MTKADKERMQMQAMQAPEKEEEQQRSGPIPAAPSKYDTTLKDRAKGLTDILGRRSKAKPAEKTSAESAAAGTDWHQMAIDTVLKGGNAKGKMNTNILSGWPAGTKPQNVPFASSIDEIARDLETMHTKSRRDWDPGTNARIQYQYGLTNNTAGI